jgi:GxxExxY protein
MSDPLFKQEGYDLIAAAFEVYDELGCGFLEDVYHEALELELSRRQIPWLRHPALRVHYKGELLRKLYVPDLIVSSGIVVELKAAKALTPEHESQVFNYLKATGHRVGYLINFGAHPKLGWQRFIFDPHASPRATAAL